MSVTDLAPSALGPAPQAKVRAYGTLIVISIIATAFNDLAPYLPVGELAKDAFVYVLPLLFFVFLKDPAEIAAPTLMTVFVLLFLAVMITGVALNYRDISVAFFRSRSGMSRVITQSMTIAFGFFVALMFYNFTRRGYLVDILRGAALGVLVMGAVGLIEFLSWYSIPGPTQLYEALSLVIHDETNEYYPIRLRSTAFEVSWAAVILTFLFPFAIADLRLTRNKRILIYASGYAITMLAQSRTAMLVITVQSLMLLFYTLKGRWDRVIHLFTGAICALFLILATPGVGPVVGEKLWNMIEYGSAGGSVEQHRVFENVSNVTRLAAIRAGVEMFQENPFFGVGLGQYGFNYPKHLRSEDFRSWEVREYAMAGDDSYGWPPTYSIHIRLMAETGMLGYALWLGMVMVLILRSLSASSAHSRLGRVHLAVAMTLVGWLLLGLSIDSFRFFGGWITIGIALALPLPAGRKRPAPSDSGGFA